MSISAPTTRPALASAKTVQHHMLGTGAAWVRLLGLRLMTWMDARVATTAAAALYQELSRLSDAELERRGIPRGELHRCVFEALDAPAARSAADGDAMK